MATVEFLRNLMDQSNRYARRIRELERRLKRIESNNNPISLIEPGDIEELFGGRQINGCHRNIVSNNIPNTVQKDQGFVLKNLQTGTDARCLIKLAVPVNRIDLVGLGFESELTADRFTIMTADLADGDSTSGMTARLFMSFISEDYDPDTVTWNNRPATINELEKKVEIASSSPVTITGTTQMKITFDYGRSMDVGFEVAKGKGLVYGLQFRVDGTLTGDLTDGLIQGPNFEVDEIPANQPPDFLEKPVLGARATYVGTIA